MSLTLTRAGAALGAFALVTALSACGGSGETSVVAATETGPTTPPTDVQVDDTYRPSLVKFLGKFNQGDAEWGAPPESILAAVKSSTVVILAKVKGITPGRTISSHPKEVVKFVDVELDPVQVLKGKLQPGLEKVLVEFGAPFFSGDPDGTEKLNKELPAGPSVWFLQWQGTRPFPGLPGLRDPNESELTHYQITSHAAIFAQGEQDIVAPMATQDEDPSAGKTVKHEAKALRKLSELVKRVRETKT